MTPREIIKLPKVVIEAGAWKVVTGKAGMPPDAFPIAKNHPLKLGRNWHWRVDIVEAAGVRYRLLVAFNPEVEEYRRKMATAAALTHPVSRDWKGYWQRAQRPA